MLTSEQAETPHPNLALLYMKINHLQQEEKLTQAAFQRLIEEFLEYDDEQTRVGELVDCMRELCHDPYSLPYMKKKILEYFESLYITQIGNRLNIVTIKRHAGEILKKFHVDSREEGGEETKKNKIVKAAAALIVKLMLYRQIVIHTLNINELGDKEKHEDYVPASLLLLSEIYRGKTMDKITSIGHCIMQLARL